MALNQNSQQQEHALQAKINERKMKRAQDTHDKAANSKGFDTGWSTQQPKVASPLAVNLSSSPPSVPMD